MATGDVWTTWNVDWSTASTADFTTNAATWQTWNTVYVTASCTTSDTTIWGQWNNVYDSSSTGTSPWRPAQRSAEEVAAEQERIAERTRIAAEAKARAEALLEEGLSEAQREEFKRERFFTVEGGHTKRRYRVKAGGRHGNIEEIDDKGVALRRLCCAPVGDIPEADALLGQKLFLEHAEEEFRRTANFTDLRRAG